MSILCNYYQQNQCRSCSWIEVDYAEQIKRKERIIETALEVSLGEKGEPSVSSTILGFRNKVKMSVSGSIQNPVIGNLGQELMSCPIQHPLINELISKIPAYIEKYQLIPYSIEKRTGELKGLIVFYSENADEFYIRFVLRSKECVSRLKKMLPDFLKEFPKVICVSANLQPIPHAIVEGGEELILTEQKYIHYQAGETQLNLAPQAFVQTNSTVAHQLYQVASDWIQALSKHEKIKMLELFCGQGLFSFYAAKFLEKGLGVELNSHAVESANKTAKTLSLQNIEFQCLDVTLSEVTHFEANLILVNPPRRGLSQSLSWIVKQKPRYLIYSSCNIESLSDDLKVLKAEYEIQKIRLFDLFPHTEHFETLVMLRLR